MLIIQRVRETERVPEFVHGHGHEIDGPRIGVDGGVALGVLPEATYEERPIALWPGDVLVLYTDGVSEAESPTGEQFGTRRIEDSVTHRHGQSAQQILDGLLADVLTWCDTRGQNDDLTLVVLRVIPETG